MRETEREEGKGQGWPSEPQTCINSFEVFPFVSKSERKRPSYNPWPVPGNALVLFFLPNWSETTCIRGRRGFWDTMGGLCFLFFFLYIHLLSHAVSLSPSLFRDNLL